MISLGMDWIDCKKAYDMLPQNWIINCLKMYKISDKVINFIEKTMKTWKVELIAKREKLSLSEGLNRYISRRCTVTVTIHNCQLCHLTKCTAGYKPSKSQEKINPLTNTADIKLFAKNEKELEPLIHAVRIYSQDILDGIWHRKTCHVSNGERKTTPDGRNGTVKSKTRFECSEKRKRTNTWVSWKRTPSNK